MIKPAEFIHPEDAAALRQLESIPGLNSICKWIRFQMHGHLAIPRYTSQTTN